ncbi:UNVERIFIED_CONTAM: E1 ubiquitin-activating protein uba2 [Siphonaria sp. JEL0065]|nr:E1 ubiquitin-activating protein uba2 [Siphonaria sp. JEL0065]
MTQMVENRHFEASRAVGVESWKRAVDKKILMVGAGGIGCELLKDLVMAGFTNIEIIDLDTIDISNLNRQFLFQKQHVKKSKAHVAKESALRFNPSINIVSHHNSIFEDQYDVAWFRSFDLIMNALDNIPARKHVNMMCRAADRPLIESGTAGYLGQVSVHLKNTQCFDCEPKPTPKTFPVCTIRSTPSTPIHCIVWSKSYLFNLLFGKDEDESSITTTADDNAQEIQDLKREADELSNIKSKSSSPDFAKLVFEKIFTRDIERLLTMSEMWSSREPPVPLSYKNLHAEMKKMKPMATGIDRNMNVWTLVENFSVFCQRFVLDSFLFIADLKKPYGIYSIVPLAKRVNEGQAKDPEFSMSFDKDDDEALDFVTAITNLRAHMYGINLQSRFKVKEMAGNIIPAISTTNAIIAGLMVLQAFKILNNKLAECKNTYLVHGGQRTQLVCGENPQPPSKECGTCQAGYFTLYVDTAKFTLDDLVGKVLGDEIHAEGEITINENGRMIYDPDFDDNGPETFESLKINNGSRILVLVDNDDDAQKSLSINFFVVHIENASTLYKLEGDKKIPPRPTVKAPEKRPLEEDEDAGASKKKAKLDDGVVEVLDDDVIIL